MKDIIYPVEMFQWHKTDSLGNTHVEIRDKNHTTVFYMRINGREYLESKRFQEELCPLIVKLMNENANFTATNSPSIFVPKPTQEATETHPTHVPDVSESEAKAEQKEGEKLEKTKRKYIKRK